MIKLRLNFEESDHAYSLLVDFLFILQVTSIASSLLIPPQKNSVHASFHWNSCNFIKTQSLLQQTMTVFEDSWLKSKILSKKTIVITNLTFVWTISFINTNIFININLILIKHLHTITYIIKNSSIFTFYGIDFQSLIKQQHHSV